MMHLLFCAAVKQADCVTKLSITKLNGAMLSYFSEHMIKCYSLLSIVCMEMQVLFITLVICL